MEKIPLIIISIIFVFCFSGCLTTSPTKIDSSNISLCPNVKKALLWLLFVLTLLFPMGTAISACFGYTFKLISVPAFAVAVAVLSVCAALAFKSPPEHTAGQILLAIIAPASFINTVFYVFEDPQISVVVSALVSVGCGCYLTVKCGKPLLLKTAALALSALMVLPVGVFCFIALTFGNIGQNTVVQTAESPSGKYYAQVIDSDQGALGGDTLVDVYEKSKINVGLFKIEKKPQRVYTGDWGEFNTMQIYWKDDDCLVINSAEYEIKQSTKHG